MDERVYVVGVVASKLNSAAAVAASLMPTRSIALVGQRTSEAKYAHCSPADGGRFTSAVLLAARLAGLTCQVGAQAVPCPARVLPRVPVPVLAGVIDADRRRAARAMPALGIRAPIPSTVNKSLLVRGTFAHVLEEVGW